MFISHNNHKVDFAPMLGEGESQWRMMEVLLYAPWFILTIGSPDEQKHLFMTHTWCIGSPHDLQGLLEDVDCPYIIALTCVMPTSFAKPGPWQYRIVLKVWSVKQGAGSILVMADEENEEFPVGIIKEDLPAELPRKLILELPRVGVA